MFHSVRVCSFFNELNDNLENSIVYDSTNIQCVSNKYI